ncbi:unnamed protein product, partial [marine sediment metagenome]
KIYSKNNLSIFKEFDPSEYVISSDGYKIYLLDVFNDITKEGVFNLYDIYKVKYTSF